MSELKNDQEFISILKLKKADIDPQAVSIIKRLKDARFDGYLVGGGVRDLLVGLKPKDFDIATNASPNEVKRKVPNCFIIGRRFKLVHARRGDKIFEIATYRREATQDEILEISSDENLSHKEENFFGSLKEDSFRRDFTVNALFFDPLSDELVDYCNGLDDIKSHTLRMIGDPAVRIKEDPVRILRALRLSQKLKFQIEPGLKNAIDQNIGELQRSVLPRRREEWLKFFRLPDMESSLMELFDLNVFKITAPSLHQLFENFEQRENFFSYIRKAKHLGFDWSSSTEIFSFIIYSYLLATHEDKPINVNEISENEHFLNFVKNELGVFKIELTQIMLSIQFIQSLANKDRYLKKGDRRKEAMLRNSRLNLSLRLGILSQDLTPADWVFWNQEFIKHYS